ncbi:MAG: DinB family protein [Bacteroidota bacterium]|nr:DinB family protein [Bacteroidota bacterium]
MNSKAENLITISFIKGIRTRLIEYLENLSEKQLLKIPQGFKNNIYWNIGHIVASQQGLLYRRSGLPLKVSEDFMNHFKNGTSPETWQQTFPISETKSIVSNTVNELEMDISKEIFNAYEAFTPSLGTPISTFDEALQYNMFHEGMHLGYIMAMKKLV